MEDHKCLSCYQPLGSNHDFHPSCSKKIFGSTAPPELPYTQDQMLTLATQIIQSQVVLTGVQPKLSLHLSKPGKNQPRRFTLIGLWGHYILKPPSDNYSNLSENEDLTMHLASLADIATVPHTLIRLGSGELAYLAKRVDRDDSGNKYPMEDMCQLTERLTEHKYNGSYEQIARTIIKYSNNPGLDVINFFEQVLFSFLTGNKDMHLKNFSLLFQPYLGYGLCPAYDMLSTALEIGRAHV